MTEGTQQLMGRAQHRTGVLLAPLPGRDEIVRLIYEMKLAGMGHETIARRLNTHEPPLSWMPKNGWRGSYATKVLRTKAVTGEFQPHAKDSNGKMQPVGDPIRDYFPAVVPEDLFYRVQDQYSRNHAQGLGGRTGKYKNLFPRLAVCHYCGSPMAFVDKGNGAKGGQYLVCDNARRGRGCVYASVHYKEVEELVLSHCKGLDVSRLLPNAGQTETEQAKLKNRLSSVSGQLAAAEEEIDNLSGTIATTADSRVREHLEKQLSQRFDTVTELQAEKEDINREMQRLASESDRLQATVDTVRELQETMQTAGEGAPQIRLRLREELRKLVDTVRIAPYGEFRVTEEWVEKACSVNGGENSSLREELEARVANKDWRWYLIRYQTGSFTMFKPGGKGAVRAMDMDFEPGKEGAALQLKGDSELVPCDTECSDLEQHESGGKTPTLEELLAELHMYDVPCGPWSVD